MDGPLFVPQSAAPRRRSSRSPSDHADCQYVLASQDEVSE